jgi:thioredoxin 1
MARETNDQNFKQDVLESDLPVLVDFWAPWCGPCRILGPIIDKISEKVQNKAQVYKLNVDENPITASNYSITAIPTVIIFKNKKIYKTFIGVQTEEVYLNALGIN